MEKEERMQKGKSEENLFYETMRKCKDVIDIVKTDLETDMEDKIDFFLHLRTKNGSIKKLSVDVKSAYSKDPSFVNINHTSRDGSLGTLPASSADLIAVRGLYDALGKLENPIEVFYFIMKENVWNTITPDMYHESSQDNSCWYLISIYGKEFGTMSGEGLAVKRSFFIDMEGNKVESKFDQYNSILK